MAGSPHASGGPRFRPTDLGFGRLFDVSVDALVVIDVEGRILLWNAGAARMFGYEPEDAVGMNVDRLVPSELRDAHHAGIARYRETGRGTLVEGGRPVELPALRRDGSRFWVDLTLSEVRHEGTRLVLAIIRDVTDRVELRDQRTRENARLHEAYDSLDAFARVVGHDLKEPVRAIGAYLEELRESPVADHPEIVERAALAHANLGRLLDGLLEWSRATDAPLDPRPLDLHRVLTDPGCTAQWEHLKEERHARVEVKRGIPMVLATEDLVCRVFGNLVTNAIRHNAKDRPTVVIRPGEGSTEESVEVLVEDDGPGFPTEALARLAAGADDVRTIKAGFGLAITMRALRRLHGSLRVEDRRGGGARVVVTLPAPPRVRSTLDDRLRDLL